MTMIIAVIPARGGSKGIPKKNIIDLCGKPLICHTIEAALASQHIDYVIVTTDCDDIISVVQSYENVFVIKRPDNLATDNALTYDAVRHGVDLFLKEKFLNMNIPLCDIILLQPTSPLRQTQHIDEAILLYQSSDVSSVMSVSLEEHSSFKNLICHSDGRITPLFTKEHLSMPRQKLPNVVRQNGAIYIVDYQKFSLEQSFYIEPAVGYMMDSISSVDIDTPSDLMHAKTLLQCDKISETV